MSDSIAYGGLSFRRRKYPIRESGAGPVLTSLNFDLADVEGGDSITITGLRLGGAISCSVGGISTGVTITNNTSTTLTFTMPAKAAGLYDVQVTTPQGTSNKLSIEAWYPGTESSCTLVCEAPDYSITDGVGTWVARKGSNLSESSTEPLDGGGYPDFTGTSSNYAISTGVVIKSLLSATQGSFAFAINSDGASASGSPQDATPWNEDGVWTDVNQSYMGLGFSINSTVSRLKWYGYNGSGYQWVQVPITTGVTQAAVARWSDGSKLEMQVDGKKADGSTLGFEESAAVFTVSNPTNLTVYLGRNWNAGRNFNGKIRAFAFFNAKISDSVAEKTNKWMRVRHGTP